MAERGVLSGINSFTDKFSGLFCGAAIDIASSSRKERNHKDSNGKEREAKRDKDNKKNMTKSEEFQMGLPPIEQDYEYDTAPGTQSFGTGLKRYVHKKTRMPRAVLTISKESIPKDVSPAELDKHLQCLCKIDHPNIVPFRECCEDHGHLKLIYEWCDGGPLLTQLWRYEGMLSEGHIAQIIRELISALVSADMFGVHHLDLSLFSLFLTYPDRLSPVKVFGFGLSGFLMPPVCGRKTSRTNKQCYCSPELYEKVSVKNLHTTGRHASDVWSVGCLLYTFCSGRPPFGIVPIKEMSQRVRRGRWTFGVEFSEYTSILKDALETMLVTDWKKRPVGQQLLSLPWVERTSTLQLKDGKVSQIALAQLQSYAQADHVKQTVARMLTDIGLTSNAYKELEDKFREMDLNGDGTIELSEMSSVASSLGIPESEMGAIVGKLDRNGNCNVDITEFVSAMVMEQENADEMLIRKAFSKMDRNGDARVTKKELFGVLRQYSGTVATEEVSNFVGKADDDGDQKIDYREFMGLFPQVRGRYEEINARQAAALHTIKQSETWFKRFQEILLPWTTKLIALRDKCEIACELREMPEHLAAGAAYSYVKGHITEFDVQVYIKELAKQLVQVPGHDLGDKSRSREMRKAKSTQQQRLLERKKQQEDQGGTTKTQMLGMAILSKAQDKAVGRASAPMARGQNSGSGDSGDSGSDDDTKIAAIRSRNALQHWELVMRQDIKKKKSSTEIQYDESAYIFLALHWLIKVKAQFHWQHPLFEIIKELRNACVEDIIEVNSRVKSDLTKISNAMDDKYVMRDDARLDDANETYLKRASRLLPMGVMEGKDFRSKVHLERIEHLALPAKLFFAYPKEDITAQRVEHMQSVHKEKLLDVSKKVNVMLAEVEELMEGVKEDMLMMGSIEEGIKTPPQMSHLFLKYCEGRELDEDALTPRINEGEEVDSDEEEPVYGSIAPGELAASILQTIDGVDASSHGVSQTMTAGSQLAGGSMKFGEKHKGKRIERNKVLTDTQTFKVKAAGEVKSGKKAK